MHRAAGTLQKSGEVMKLMNSLIRLPEAARTMQDMSKEMMKAGVIEEMVNDAMDSALDTEDMEEETEQQVDAVLSELAVAASSAMPLAGRSRVSARRPGGGPQQRPRAAPARAAGTSRAR